jgi:FlaA1/EpsC-like NDP-sugar epimerase
MQFALDLCILVLSFVVAYLLRFEFDLPSNQFENLLAQLPLVVVIQLVALIAAGVYSFIWRYVGLAELWSFFKAAFWSGSVLVVGRLLLPDSLGQLRVPFSIIFTDTVLALLGVVGLRVFRRVLFERYEKSRHFGQPSRRRPVLMVGAGRAGVLAAREISTRGDMDVWIEGFVDDDERKHGSVIQGKKILGGTEDLPRLCAEVEVDHVVITIAQVARSELRRIVDICERIPVRVRIIPGLYEILDGRVQITRFRDLQIEDLLGRDPVELDEEVVAGFIKGKTVMVTGAGGSIGSELARQVARFEPDALLMVERAEFALFEIDRDLRETWPGTRIESMVADICDELRMRTIFDKHRPALVFHAAAHKHVPLAEGNPCEAVKNNAIGTSILGDLAGEFDAEAFVLISTDKAVRPSSIMGASKRVAELAAQELDSRYETRYVAVRFGNVLGSAGSVIPLFREQILNGGPVTVTHPDMVRYFMTIPEAAQLVMQAGAMGKGGEIFVLDMGEPIKIVDLARDMIALGGLRPYEDINIEFTGIRPGEKLFEELDTDGEGIAKTRHPKIFIGTIESHPPDEVRAALTELTVLSLTGEEQSVREYLSNLLPESQLQG